MNFPKLIKQAHLTLSDQEKDKIHGQIDEALKAIEVLNELDTTQVGQATSASGLTNIWREDIVQSSFPQELALQNAKQTHHGYFMVPAIFEPKDT